MTTRHRLDRRRPDRRRDQGRPLARAAAAARRPRGVRRRRDPFPVTGWDAIVLRGRQRHPDRATTTSLAWGMELEAYSGPENGNRDHKSYVLRSGSIRFVFTGAVDARQPAPRPPPPARRRCRRHRPRGARRRPVHRAGPRGRRDRPRASREDVTDEHGTVRIAAIATYGETRHTLVDRRGETYAGPYLPGYVAVEPRWEKKDGQPKRLFQALDSSGCSRSATRSSTCAGAASRPWIPARRHRARALALREPHEPPRARRDPALPRRLQRDRDPLPLRGDVCSRASSASSPATTSSPSPRGASSCASSVAPCCGKAPRTSSSRRPDRWTSPTKSSHLSSRRGRAHPRDGRRVPGAVQLGAADYYVARSVSVRTV